MKTVIASDLSQSNMPRLVEVKYDPDKVESQFDATEAGEYIDLPLGRLWLERRKLVKGSWRLVAENIIEKHAVQ